MTKPIDIDALTLEELIQISQEAILEAPPSLTTPAALAFREAIERDLLAIQARGCVPDLPFE